VYFPARLIQTYNGPSAAPSREQDQQSDGIRCIQTCPCAISPPRRHQPGTSQATSHSVALSGPYNGVLRVCATTLDLDHPSAVVDCCTHNEQRVSGLAVICTNTKSIIAFIVEFSNHNTQQLMQGTIVLATISAPGKSPASSHTHIAHNSTSSVEQQFVLASAPSGVGMNAKNSSLACAEKVRGTGTSGLPLFSLMVTDQYG
jgi:hypothetical protein